MFNVDQKTIDWLLEENNPPVKYLTLINLLELSYQDSGVAAVRTKINSFKPIEEILNNQEESTYWFDKVKTKNYKIYLGSFWQIIFLHELNAQKNQQIDNGIEHIFTTGQASNGGFSVSGTNSGSITCLTANLVRALIHFGYWEDERTRKAVDFILNKLEDKESPICYPLPSLLKNCYMTLPKVIHALGSIPEEDQTSRIKKSIEYSVNIMLENQIYKYVPAMNKDWLKHVNEKKLKGKQVFEERDKFLENNPTVEKIEKPGWKKFGFPLNYNSDILDALRSLALVKHVSTPEIDATLEILKDKSIAGKWLNEKQYKSPTYAKIDDYKEESKWITYHALAVLKHFEGIVIK